MTMTKEERAAGVRARRKQRRETARAVKAANVWQPPALSAKAQRKRERRANWARRLARATQDSHEDQGNG